VATALAGDGSVRTAAGAAREVYLDWETEARAMLRRFRLGPVTYCHVVLQVADHPEQTLVTYAEQPLPAGDLRQWEGDFRP
jgi:hypothetical protein